VKVGEDADFPNLCERCAPVVKALETGRAG
jgi:hypothetical protein